MRAALFDLDDTLFDHRHAARCVLRAFQVRHPGLATHPIERLEEWDVQLLDQAHANVMAGRLDPDESRVRRIVSLFERCGLPLPEGEAETLARERVAIYRDSRRAVPGAIALLGELRRRVRIGVVTNNFHEEQVGKLAACGLTELVDVLVTSEAAGWSKPAPEIFREALRRLDGAPEEAVMVGDSWEIDVLGARGAGIRAVWFNPRALPMPDLDGVTEIRSLEPAIEIASEILER